MNVSEDEWTEFLDRNKTGEIHDFCIWLGTVEGRLFVRKQFSRVFFMALSVADEV